jgi:DNA-binding winged helix-turn-helix (wHTH) protein
MPAPAVMLIHAHGLFGPRRTDVLAQHHAIVRFEGFVLDRTTGELSREGHRVPLQDQPARVLAYLVTHHGQLITRDTLRRVLWPDGTYVEFNTGLNVSINKIRTALGDSATQPRFIETLPRRGYRFIASVRPLTRRARTWAALVRVWRRLVAPHV